MTHKVTWLQPVVVLGLCLSAAALQAQYLETVIPVGESPQDILWNPVSNKVYTANGEAGSVTIIDGATNHVRATVAVPDCPTFLCWNSVNNRVYVTCGDQNWLCVIDGVGDTLVRKVRIRGYPCNMAFDAMRNKLYVESADDMMIRVYDGTADTLVAEAWIGVVPWKLLWHPATDRVFVSTECDTASSLYVIDCSADTVAARVHHGATYDMCRNPVNNLVYVNDDHGTSVVSQFGDSVLTLVPIYGWSMCFVPRPNSILTAWNSVGVIDCDSNLVRATIPIGATTIVADTLRGKAYAANYNSGQLHVIDALADTLIKTMPMGTYPYAMCWNSTNSRVYVADGMANVVYIIRDTSSAIEEDRSYSARPRLGATVTCGTLFLPGQREADVFSVSGCRVAVLHPGRNSLRALAPGTYFVRPIGTKEVQRITLVR